MKTLEEVRSIFEADRFGTLIATVTVTGYHVGT